MSMILKMNAAEATMDAAIDDDGEVVILVKNGAGGVEIIKQTPGFLESMTRAAMKAAALMERQAIQRNAAAATRHVGRPGQAVDPGSAS
jgi:hypothetical protein